MHATALIAASGFLVEITRTKFRCCGRHTRGGHTKELNAQPNRPLHPERHFGDIIDLPTTWGSGTRTRQFDAFLPEVRRQPRRPRISLRRSQDTEAFP